MKTNKPATLEEFRADTDWFSQQVESASNPVDDDAYYLAFDFVAAIEPPRYDESRLNGHWHNTDGELLVTLDRIVAAVLGDDIELGES